MWSKIQARKKTLRTRRFQSSAVAQLLSELTPSVPLDVGQHPCHEQWGEEQEQGGPERITLLAQPHFLLRISRVVETALVRNLLRGIPPQVRLDHFLLAFDLDCQLGMLQPPCAPPLLPHKHLAVYQLIPLQRETVEIVEEE